MTSKQINQNEFITQAVAEATRVAIQTMVITGMARQENAGTKMSELILKQPMLNWRAEDKYEELQNLKLEVSYMSQNYNLGKQKKYL